MILKYYNYNYYYRSLNELRGELRDEDIEDSTGVHTNYLMKSDTNTSASATSEGTSGGDNSNSDNNATLWNYHDDSEESSEEGM